LTASLNGIWLLRYPTNKAKDFLRDGCHYRAIVRNGV
jgi:hypothetical protein